MIGLSTIFHVNLFKSFISVSFPVVAGGSALIFVASATALSPLVTASLGVLGIGKIYSTHQLA